LPKPIRLAICFFSSIVSLVVSVYCLNYLPEAGESKPANNLIDVAFASLKSVDTSVDGRPSASKSPVEFWPPVADQRYPDMNLEDGDGNMVRLSNFAGKVILVELVAIPCEGCQAFAGGNRLGGFEGMKVQSGLGSIHDYAKRYAKVQLGETEGVVFVQLILFGKDIGQPTREETRGWAEHFGMHRNANLIVLRGDASMVNRTSFKMIPGFHLIDRNFQLVSDSCGHNPKDDLYKDLLPMLGKLSREPVRSTTSTSSPMRNPYATGNQESSLSDR
jgi:hypothetical protein